MLVRGLARKNFGLTFDDGPDPDLSARVSDALLAAGATATFFMLGSAARKHPELVRRIAADGHVIGHHSMTHQPLAKLSRRKALEEWRAGRDTVEEITGKRCPYFRPPYGSMPLYLLPAIWKEGDTVVMWSCSTRDFTGAPVEALMPRLRSRGISQGEIFLLHDVSPAAPGLVKELLSMGSAAGMRAVGVDSMTGH
jgi:peptidoglycan/xylan/chitin deacetylase (PgdA/CDA1 family)